MDMARQRIVVTGGAGFLGRHVVAELGKAGAAEQSVLIPHIEQFDLTVERFEASLAGQQGAIEFRHNLALALQNIGLIDRADATWHSICELSCSAGTGLGCDRIQSIRDSRPE